MVKKIGLTMATGKPMIRKNTVPDKQGFMWSARPSRQQSGEAPVERNPYPALYMEIGLGFGCDKARLTKKML